MKAQFSYRTLNNPSRMMGLLSCICKQIPNGIGQVYYDNAPFNYRPNMLGQVLLNFQKVMWLFADTRLEEMI